MRMDKIKIGTGLDEISFVGGRRTRKREEENQE